MRVYHPQGMTNNMPPENVFIAADEMGNEIGMGYIIRMYQPNIFPDRPINLFITMECQPVARYILFGALVARARQMRDENPMLRARVYTAITPSDTQGREFYTHNGFVCDATEDLLRLTIPEGDGKIPMSCAVAQVPLNTPEEQNAFIGRLVMNDLNFVDQGYLLNLMHMPHFLALGLYRNTDLIGEILMAGEGDSCDLVAIYIVQGSRQQGMGRALLHRSMAVMASEGVTKVTTRIMSGSEPQKHLMDDFYATVLGTSTVYPGLNID